MIRYLKVEMVAPNENENGLYCTLTKVAVYGTSMHQVMRNTLKGLGSSSTASNSTDLIAEEAETIASAASIINL